MRSEEIKLTSHPNVTLRTYLLDSSKEFHNIGARPAILICPGGGYHFCSDREAEPVAMAFLAEGYQAFVLTYTVGPQYEWPDPLTDAEEALTMIHARAEDWQVDPKHVAVAGFSAGGHLAAALGTLGKIRPNAVIAGYPCIIESISRLLAFEVPALDQNLDSQTPPVFLFSTCEDDVVPVRNSIRFMAALNDAGIPFESHIFQFGVHGLSLAKAHVSDGNSHYVNATVAQWLPMCIDWLHKIWGNYPANEDRNIPTAKDVQAYTLDVTLKSIWPDEACRSFILEAMPLLKDREMLELAWPFTLRMLQNMVGLKVGFSEKDLTRLGEKLAGIAYTA